MLTPSNISRLLSSRIPLGASAIYPQDYKPPDLLSNGQIKLKSAQEIDSIPKDTLRMWCHLEARYGIVTSELIEWLNSYINGRKAIEIGSGSGDLAHHLGIKGTDNKMQDDPSFRINGLSVKDLYLSTGQPIIKYPSWVEKLAAGEAVEKYKPEVVVGMWVTHWIDPSKPPPPGGGNCFGVVEEDIIKRATYIMIGNRYIHQYKPALKLPHQELELPFLRSRRPDENVIYIWEKQ